VDWKGGNAFTLIVT